MKLSEKKQSNFTPHPETDTYVKAVIVDVTPLFTKVTEHGTFQRFQLIFESEMEMEQDKRFILRSRPFNFSKNGVELDQFYEKHAWNTEFRRIFGRDATSAEKKNFDTDDLIGLGVKIIVTNVTIGESTYANIGMMKPDNSPLKPSGKYKRIKDREDKADSYDRADSADDGGGEQTDDGGEDVDSGWSKVVIHVGKHKGKTLGALVESDDAAVRLLMAKWLPQAKAAKNLEDAGLVAALDELAVIAPDDIPY